MRGSQLLQKMFSCSLLICFLFWDSPIGQFVANTRILVKQLKCIINFSFCDIPKKTVNWRWFCDIPSATAKEIASVAVIWDKESGPMFSLPLQLALNEGQQSNRRPTRTNIPFIPARYTVRVVFYRWVLINQAFVFFESSIIRKIGPSSRPGAGRVVFRIGPFLKVVSHVIHRQSIWCVFQMSLWLSSLLWTSKPNFDHPTAPTPTVPVSSAPCVLGLRRPLAKPWGHAVRVCTTPSVHVHLHIQQ